MNPLDHILILYSTTDGHTREIALRLKQVIEKEAHQVTLVKIDEASDLDLGSFDKIVIGASVRYGRHAPSLVRFIQRYAELISIKPNAFFSVSIVARKMGKNRPETNPYLLKFLRHISWRPQIMAVFAGKLDYPRYRFFDRLMIRLIMRMTGGPTDPTAVIEFTDWRQVETFARRISRM